MPFPWRDWASLVDRAFKFFPSGVPLVSMAALPFFFPLGRPWSDHEEKSGLGNA